MLFTVWSDTGSEVKAYCVPDSFASQSRLNLYSGGSLITSVASNSIHQNLIGRHETGQVGFEIDESAVAGLSGFADLEIREADSDVLIYRRTSLPCVQQAVFRLETQLVPLKAIDFAFKDKFRYWYDSIDRYSAETTRQILIFHTFGSLYSSGRIIFQNFDYYLWNNQKVIMMMQDPFRELASRLIAFKTYTGEALRAILSERDQVIFEPILDFVEDFQTFEPKEVKNIFGRASRQTLAILSNPVTRQLTASLPDEVLVRNNVPQALRRIAEFDVIGLKEDAQHFLTAVTEMLAIEPIELHTSDSEVHRVAENLRTVPWLESVIEQDLELYQHIEAAYAAV